MKDTTTILSMKGFKTTNPWSCCTRNWKGVSRLGGPPGMAQSTAGPDPPGAAPGAPWGRCGVRGTVSAWRILGPLFLAVQRRSSSHCRKGFSTAKKLVIASWNTAGEKKTKTLPGHSSRNMTSPLLPSSETLVTIFNWQMLTHIHQPSCKNVNALPC